MEHTLLVDRYHQRRIKFEAQLHHTRKIINRIANVRILVALIFLGLAFVAFQNHILFYFLPVLVIVFISLVYRHSFFFDKKVHLENLVTINVREAKALEGDFSQFSSGVSFTDPKHFYSHDLDLFGEGSLFQYLNRTNTFAGTKQFVGQLKNPFTSHKQIHTYQQSSKELSTQLDFCQDFQASAMEVGEQQGDREQISAWLRSTQILRGIAYRYLLWVVPALTLLIIILSFFVPLAKPIAILLVLFQWTFLAFHLKKVNAFHAYVSRRKNVLEKYSRLLSLVQKQNFSSPLLQELKNLATEAHAQVKDLSSLVNALDARMNLLMNMVGNSLLLYDLQCVYRLEKWKSLHADKLESWIDLLGEVEVLISLGTFAYNNPDFCTPEIHGSIEIKATAMGHPLIGRNERILNDVVLNEHQKILIVTGANMAGKSTFLRTLGVNTVLALMGARVCATEFKSPILELRTGMRTADSLKDHQSYFYAELNRLKSIMDELKSNKPLLILLDEILKGTNSTDKQSGSIALVKQLMVRSCLAVIATHDLVLGELENEYPDRVKNFCFEAEITNDQLSFDYKLKRGLAQKMNATFLMKKMGIIPS